MNSRDAKRVTDLKEACLARFRVRTVTDGADPLANRVRALAVELADALDTGATTLGDLRAMIGAISDDAVVDRIRRFAHAHAQTLAPTGATSADALRSLDALPADALISRIARPFAGIVFTAHPTFANSRALRQTIGELASGGPEQVRDGAVVDAHHAPDPDITLDHEHAEAVGAIEKAQDAIATIRADMLRWLRARLPERWREAAPNPISIATWVGYDLDGRADIHWTASVRLRLEEKAAQLERYERAARDIADRFAVEPLRPLMDRLGRAAAHTRAIASAFAGDLTDPARVVTAANALTEDHPDRIVSLRPTIEELSALIGATGDDEAALMLMLLRAEMQANGLGLARVHLRINAAQVQSALTADLGLPAEFDLLNRSALPTAALRSTSVRAIRVNFSQIFLEKMTARRQMMLCAQFIKHVDADMPIRFLIAECEAPATVMGAIFLARLYGVDSMIDISPLFEAPDAIERGGRFLERLFEEPVFIDYIRGRGRIAIQLGFSDSGRFMGQIAADLAIERLQILLAKILREKSVTDVEAVVFNTHGESMGRGGFPGDLAMRFDHLMTPQARWQYQDVGVPLNPEVSFQGGDGYLNFQTSALARSTVLALFAWATRPIVERPANSDAFYRDINFSWDIYRAVKSWQEAMFADPDYQALLGAFGSNLLVTSGSRKLRRQSGASKGHAARALRAIPHNAILQQLAAPANVFGGIGFAASREPERFQKLVKGSPRVAALLRMAMTARNLTSLSILRSYGSLYDASFWTIRARLNNDEDKARIFTRIAQRLGAHGYSQSFASFANSLSIDRRRLDRAANPAGERASAQFPHALYVLHASRMALMMHAFARVAALPSFSDRHEVSMDAILDETLALGLTDVAGIISEIFPASADIPPELSQVREDADLGEPMHGYPQIINDIVRPLGEIDRVLKDASVGIAHFYGAWG